MGFRGQVEFRIKLNDLTFISHCGLQCPKKTNAVCRKPDLAIRTDQSVYLDQQITLNCRIDVKFGFVDQKHGIRIVTFSQVQIKQNKWSVPCTVIHAMHRDPCTVIQRFMPTSMTLV